MGQRPLAEADLDQPRQNFIILRFYLRLLTAHPPLRSLGLILRDLLVQLLVLSHALELLTIPNLGPLLDARQGFLVVVQQPVCFDPLQRSALVSKAIDADAASDRHMLEAGVLLQSKAGAFIRQQNLAVLLILTHILGDLVSWRRRRHHHVRLRIIGILGSIHRRRLTVLRNLNTVGPVQVNHTWRLRISDGIVFDRPFSL